MNIKKMKRNKMNTIMTMIRCTTKKKRLNKKKMENIKMNMSKCTTKSTSRYMQVTMAQYRHKLHSIQDFLK